ncbi:hypothetical protein Aglo03_25590 [Actinokineospora globicatena]|uniref:Uncharacterized protein n=1 Tax=Actinokineospora globicatena TaxID=103729 RepID=A0A9W6VA96_9PSEU|nr:hypothetical protein Aglo03_25590 [Actinokineospora globicatena]
MSTTTTQPRTPRWITVHANTTDHTTLTATASATHVNDTGGATEAIAATPPKTATAPRIAAPHRAVTLSNAA